MGNYIPKAGFISNPAIIVYSHGSEQLKLLKDILIRIEDVENELEFVHALIDHYYEHAWDPDITIEGPDKMELVDIAKKDSEIHEDIKNDISKLLLSISGQHSLDLAAEKDFGDIHYDALDKINTMIQRGKRVMEDDPYNEEFLRSYDIWCYIRSCVKAMEGLEFY